jgi:hypothetical protein
MKTSRVITIILIAAGLLALAHLYLLDGVFGSMLTLFYRDETHYAPGYSDAEFRHIAVGMDEASVRAHLSDPLKEDWGFGQGSEWLVVSCDNQGRVGYIGGTRAPEFAAQLAGRKCGEVTTVAGVPSRKTLVYTEPEHDSSDRVRAVLLTAGRGEREFHEYYVD